MKPNSGPALPRQGKSKLAKSGWCRELGEGRSGRQGQEGWWEDRPGPGGGKGWTSTRVFSL